jgi:hypothetical protein
LRGNHKKKSVKKKPTKSPAKKPAASSPDPPPVLGPGDIQKVRIKDLIRIWGISEQMIYKHIREGNLPAAVAAYWDWPDINHAFLKYHKDRAKRKDTSEDSLYKKEKIVDLETKITKLAENKSQLCIAAQVERAAHNFTKLTLDSMMAIKDRAAPMLAPRLSLAKVKAILDKEIRKACEVLTNEYLPGGKDDTE